MDFATVRKKLDAGAYSYLEEFEVGLRRFSFVILDILSLGSATRVCLNFICFLSPWEQGGCIAFFLEITFWFDYRDFIL